MQTLPMYTWRNCRKVPQAPLLPRACTVMRCAGKRRPMCLSFLAMRLSSSPGDTWVQSSDNLARGRTGWEYVGYSEPKPELFCTGSPWMALGVGVGNVPWGVFAATSEEGSSSQPQVYRLLPPSSQQGAEPPSHSRHFGGRGAEMAR